MSNYAQHISKSKKSKSVREDAPQTAKADERQVKNTAGGFTFEVDCWKRLARFLILGAEGGTYYATEREIVKGNVKALDECLAIDAAATVEEIAKLSESGRAPKNDPAIFALAYCAAHKEPTVRRLALAALPRVCRIGTHLFQFCEQIGDVRKGAGRKGRPDQLRGWGSGLRRAISRWYTDKDARSLAYQLVKYQQRNGVAHRDVIRLAHPKGKSEDIAALLRWTMADGKLDERSIKRKQQEAAVVYGALSRDVLPPLIGAIESMRACAAMGTINHGNFEADVPGVQSLIREYRMTHEMVPSQFLGKAEIWDALLDSMPMHACVRNLGRMTANGLLVDGSDAVKRVVAQLGDYDAIKKSRLHPFSVLLALRTYSSGHGEKGKLTWKPVRSIESALDDAFYMAFDSVETTGKSHLLALDISGSMDSAIMGSSMTHREAVAVMAMVTARSEKDTHMIGFTSGGGHGAGKGTTPINITKATKLQQALKIMQALPMGSTDCSQPMLYAMEAAKTFEAFCVYTDNETYAGSVHPHVALQRYRQKTGIPAKLVVVATAATPFTIADPTDAGMLDVVGLDASGPAVIADFIRN